MYRKHEQEKMTTKKKYILTGVIFAITSIAFVIYAFVTQDFKVAPGAMMQTSAGMYFLFTGLTVDNED